MGFSSRAPAEHGGNLSQAAVRFGIPEEDWLDLSTGISPIPYPDTALSPASLARLPSAGGLAALLSAARAAYGVPAAGGLCAAAGTQALIQALPLVTAARDVAVLSPTYSEHAQVWRSSGRAVREVTDLAETGGAAVVIVTSPNNPDGRRWDPAALDAVRAPLARAGGLLIVDEAFADVAPEISLAPMAGADGLVVLRSFGKFFGLAGLRLGFAAGPPALIAEIEARLGPWAVSGPALEIGRRALADRRWIAETRARLAALRHRLDELLRSAGYELIGGTDLFRLVACDDAQAVFLALARAGVLTRPFAGQPRWLRIGIPGDAAAFDRLARALPQ
jgi:cobalamin biosynthetic protein CobC